MIELPLSKGYSAKIDDEYSHLAAFKWSAYVRGKNGLTRVYACRMSQGKMLLLHREIMGHTSLDIDHKNSDGTDCQKSNMRFATRSQNNANSRKRSFKGTPSSRYKGVHFHRGGGKWTAQIRKRHLGMFRDEFDAATAYNFAAEEDYGEFARYNLP